MNYKSNDIAKAFIARLAKVNPKQATKELAALILNERLQHQIDDIVESIIKEYALKHGIIEAEVSSAFRLSDKLRTELIKLIKSSSGAKKVLLHETVDNSLLGGLIISAPDMQLDFSLKTKLNRLKV